MKGDGVLELMGRSLNVDFSVFTNQSQCTIYTYTQWKKGKEVSF